MLFLCYSRCSTCRKAQNWLESNNKQFEARDIKSENPTREELEKWYKKSGLDIKKFFNTSGMLYKEMGLKDKLKEMTLDEKLDLLSTDGLLVKRPILVTEDNVLVGFKPEDWEERAVE